MRSDRGELFSFRPEAFPGHTQLVHNRRAQWQRCSALAPPPGSRWSERDEALSNDNPTKMSIHNNFDQTYCPPIKPHARERWQERTSADRPLEAAWRAAKPVEAPAARCAYARLYEPSDVLMLVRAGWLRTVLINDGRLERKGLVMCEGCDDLVDPISDEECPWCGNPQPAVQKCGRITVVRGDEQ